LGDFIHLKIGIQKKFNCFKWEVLKEGIPKNRKRASARFPFSTPNAQNLRFQVPTFYL